MRFLTTTAMLTTLAGTAYADGLTYGLLEYQYIKIDNEFDDELTFTDLQGSVTYEVDRFVLTGDFNNTTNSSAFGDSSAQIFGASAAYRVSPEILAGVGVDRYNYETYEFTEYETFVQYHNGTSGGGLLIINDPDYVGFATVLSGEGTVAPGITLSGITYNYSEFDGTTYHLAAEYENGPLFLRVFHQGDTEYDFSFNGVRAEYEIAPRYRVAGSIAAPRGEFVPDVYSYQIGGGVNVRDGVWIDAAYGRVAGDDIVVETTAISAAISFEVGERTRLDTRLSEDQVKDFGLFGMGGPV